MVDGTMISAERAAVVGMLAAWTIRQWQGLRLWLTYRPERRYMRGPSAV